LGRDRWLDEAGLTCCGDSWACHSLLLFWTFGALISFWFELAEEEKRAKGDKIPANRVALIGNPLRLAAGRTSLRAGLVIETGRKGMQIAASIKVRTDVWVMAKIMRDFMYGKNKGRLTGLIHVRNKGTNLEKVRWIGKFPLISLQGTPISTHSRGT